MAEGGVGKGRQRREGILGSNSPLGFLYRAVGQVSDVEIRDQGQAERAQRLARFIQGDPVPEVWTRDLWPLLVKVYDDALELVKEKKLDPDVLKGLEDFVSAIDGGLVIGAGAMKRIAERRLQTSSAAVQKGE